MVYENFHNIPDGDKETRLGGCNWRRNRIFQHRATKFCQWGVVRRKVKQTPGPTTYFTTTPF